MTYRAMFYLLAGLAIPGVCIANDAAFCTSMCESQQNECRANTEPVERAGLLAPTDNIARNPLARTAQGEVPGQGARALNAAGETQRRLDRADTCNRSFQRCSRSCAVEPQTPMPGARQPGTQG